MFQTEISTLNELFKSSEEHLSTESGRNVSLNLLLAQATEANALLQIQLDSEGCARSVAKKQVWQPRLMHKYIYVMCVHAFINVITHIHLSMFVNKMWDVHKTEQCLIYMMQNVKHNSALLNVQCIVSDIDGTKVQLTPV